jgi:ribosome-binding factor A
MKIRKLPKIRYRYDGKWELSQKICETISELTNK